MLQKPLLAGLCVVMWVLFRVFLTFCITLFDDYTKCGNYQKKTGLSELSQRFLGLLLGPGKNIGLWQKPIIRSEKLPYQAYVTPFLRITLFLDTFLGHFFRRKQNLHQVYERIRSIRYQNGKLNVFKNKAIKVIFKLNRRISQDLQTKAPAEFLLDEIIFFCYRNHRMEISPHEPFKKKFPASLAEQRSVAGCPCT